MLHFSAGLITMGFLVITLFFLKFWRRTGDLLFLAFAVSFSLLALNQALTILIDVARDERSYLYLLRLVAFLIIIAAVVHKNATFGPRDRSR
ncbi:hypothetical protein ASG72_03350 [Bosea sp. Leaf344]|uniref:DUF5985 family protein n=1 Tax=Bosea sp. Leaf344 TaxID=1736346 RepID=UPI0006FB5178|nr:DUF5985 family protein [Bosea sp. Leaf344]KQU54673.1 hypothetical protein ASG72_03350 [Bosea sp. Leaf344]